MLGPHGTSSECGTRETERTWHPPTLPPTAARALSPDPYFKALSASHSVEADKACRQGLPTRLADKATRPGH